MGSSADGEFTRWGVQEMGSSRDGEFTRWGVYEKRIHYTVHSTQYTVHITNYTLHSTGLQGFRCSRDVQFRIWGVQQMGS